MASQNVDNSVVRPFPDVLGQESAVGTLAASLAAGRAPHAYVFTGPAGVGKKTAARAWAKTLLCATPLGPATPCGACPSCKKIDGRSHPDLLWIDFEFQSAFLKEPLEKQKSIKIATVREMERLLRLKPMEGRVKVAVLTCADLLGDDASHALLKILEEPPSGTHLVLISIEAGSLLATLRSRCQRVRFQPLPVTVVSDIVAREHGHRPAAEVDRAVRAADGSVDRARALLEENNVLAFDWAACPLSELLSWCEGFQNPRVGRTGAERFLEALLARFQTEVRAGARPPEDLERSLKALTRIRQNANVGLTLQHLLLHIRRNARKTHGG